MKDDSEPSIFHLAVHAEWEEARVEGSYRRSTVGRSLEDVGYVHCATAEQVRGVADRYYRGRDDVVLLTIDPRRLDTDVRYESLPGSEERFPHVYGPIPTDAVVRAEPVALDSQGRLRTEELEGLSEAG